jgi:aminocarboxymuconate-semialdehyde decarboxylase
MFGEDAELVTLRLSRPPIEYFRSFYADTAIDAPHAVRCALDFSGPDRILFATDSPLGGEATSAMSRGEAIVRSTVQQIESLDLSQDVLEKIFFRNAEDLLGIA